MQLMFYYIAFMVVGDVADYGIGLLVEREFGGQVSLVIFLLLYFASLWLAWILAVWVTEPKGDKQAAG